MAGTTEGGPSRCGDAALDEILLSAGGAGRQKLFGNPRRVADEEDVAISAFHSFCHGVKEDRFRQLATSNDLWQVLAVITTRKALRQIEREMAQKRGGGGFRGESAFLKPDGQLDAAGIEQFIGSVPRLNSRPPAKKSLLGCSTASISPSCARSPCCDLTVTLTRRLRSASDATSRSVERKLNLIRSLISQEQVDDEQ